MHLARLDPFGQTSARSLLEAWLGALFALHVLFVLGGMFLGSWLDGGLWVAMVLGFGVALALSHPAARLALLGVWLGWWTLLALRRPGVHPSFALMMAMSVYVMARVVWTWSREGRHAVTKGSVGPEQWPELAGFTKHERRLLLGRARRHYQPRADLRPRFARMLIVFLCLLVVSAGLGVEVLKLLPACAAISPLLGVRDPDPAEEAALRHALRERVIPQFWREPWHWDQARREAMNQLPA